MLKTCNVTVYIISIFNIIQLISNIQLIYPTIIQLIQLLHVCKMLHSFYINTFPVTGCKQWVQMFNSCIDDDDIGVLTGTKFLLKF